MFYGAIDNCRPYTGEGGSRAAKPPSESDGTLDAASTVQHSDVDGAKPQWEKGAGDAGAKGPGLVVSHLSALQLPRMIRN